MSKVEVGIALIIRRDSRVLVQRRLTKVGYGCWGSPGGHLELWETFEGAALRELQEEAGPEIRVSTPIFWRAANCFHHEADKHYVVLFVVSDYISGEAILAEPTKAESWQWCAWLDIPHPRMPGMQWLFDNGLEPWSLETK